MRRSSTTVWWAVLALALSACGGDDSEGTAAGGGEVTILGGWVDTDADNFREAITPFEEETGIEITYTGSPDFETQLITRIEGGNPPDVAFPPPGLLQGFAESGDLRPLDGVVDVDALEEATIAGFLDTARVDDAVYGVPFRVTLKSLVWYPKEPFESAYTTPETWQQLQDLTATLRDGDGPAPWCLAIEASGSTGWVVTDWIEELLLRTAGPDAYDRWVAGELPFASPEVTRAAEMFADLALTEGNVLGGRQGMLQTPFGDAPLPMFEDPPACLMHRQASFITGFFPDDVTVGEDVDFFYFPPAPGVGEYDGEPVLGAGAFGTLMTDNPAAEQFVEFLTRPEAGQAWAEAGGFLSPYESFDTSLYPDESTRRQAQILRDADVFRFDASDLMPGPVGAGAFWSEMVAWISGQQELQESLENIDAAWPDEGS